MHQLNKGDSVIDVSHWQDNPTTPNDDIDWRAVAASGVKGVYVKATQKWPDRMFVVNWRGAIAAGLKVGAYHFFVVDRPPAMQAALFCDTVERQGEGWGDLPMMIDVEVLEGGPTISQTQYTRNLQEMAELVEKKTKRKPGFYTSSGMWPILTTEPAWAEAYPLWVAHHGAKSPTLPKPWKNYLLWQTTDKGRIPGIAYNVDLNIWNWEPTPKTGNKITLTLTDAEMLAQAQEAAHKLGAVVSTPQQRVWLSFAAGTGLLHVGLEDSALTTEAIGVFTSAGFMLVSMTPSVFCEGETGQSG